jgi:regulator of replication initiation timing
VNERERNLLEHIKVLKLENKKLMQLLQESETLITEKIGKQKRETDQIMSILAKLWPLLMRTVG